jgi:5-methylcytosine-specific restriction endonuclease McrA
LENEISRDERAAELRTLSGLEIPVIIADVVDLLLPELTPYETAFYIYLLRHSIIEQGNPHIRASTYGLRSGVVKSVYAGSKARRDSADNAVSLPTVRQVLVGLTAIGAIRQEAEPNREGTLYRVLMPEEIPVCQRRRAERQTNVVSATVDHREIDFYNIRENRLKIFERDSYKCIYCDKQLTRFTATLDHITPVSEGGDNSAENLKTACLQCNSRKAARPLGDFLIESDAVRS